MVDGAEDVEGESRQRDLASCRYDYLASLLQRGKWRRESRPVGSALGALVGGFYSAEICLYLAAIIFGVQALVILLSPAVSLARQPEMVGDGPEAKRTC